MFFDDRPGGRGNHEHLLTVVYTGWFFKRFWVRCWECNLRRGPFIDAQLAWLEVEIMEHKSND